MTILSRIQEHLRQHHDSALEICPMVINKQELIELLDTDLILLCIGSESRKKILAMDHGFIGHFQSVPLYLFDELRDKDE